jgi:hypothetical protein
MKLFTLSALLCAICLNSFSQKKSYEGYYKDWSGGVTKGSFPGYKQWERNPSQVEFITTDNKKLTLLPVNCAYFEVTGFESYISYKGLRQTNPIEDSKTETTDSTARMDSLHAFLRILYANSDITLYSFKDKQRVNLFYKRNGGPIVELEKRLYIHYIGNRKYFGEIAGFRQQLKNEFYDKIEIKKLQFELNNLIYSEKSIIKFMDHLHETSTAKKYNKYPSEIFIGGGAAFNMFSYQSVDQNDIESMIDYNSPVKPVIIIGGNFYMSRNFGRIFISPRIKLFSQVSSGEKNITLSPSSSYTVKSTFSNTPFLFGAVNISYLLLNKDKLSWYISAGPAVAGFVNNKEEREQIIPGQQNIKQIAKDNKFSFVVNAETGFRVNEKLLVSVNYMPPITVQNYVVSIAKFSSLQVCAAWIFNIKKR